MDFPLRRDGIPTGEGRALRRHLRRTALLRAVFALALLGALAYAFVLTRGAEARRASLIPADTTAVLVLDLSASIGDYHRVGGGPPGVPRGGELAVLAVFTDGRADSPPPASPGGELEPFARFFTP